MKDQNFLDKNTLFSVLLLGCCWIAWDFYMKKKYPPTPKLVVQEEAESKKAPEETPIEKPKSSPAKLFYFSGEEMEITFSSLGFGIEQAQLKNHFDRNQKPILFKKGRDSLFATQELTNKQALEFEIVKKSNYEFEGRFSSDNFDVIKTVTVDDKAFSVKTKLEIQQKKQPIEGLAVSFSHPLPEEEDEAGFLDLFNVYGRDIFKGLIVSDQDQVLFSEDPPERQTNASFVALGGKYFGQAFINKSNLLPSADISFEGEQVFADLKYKFLHDKSTQLEYTVFLGPKTFKNLVPLDSQAKEWVDFGLFSWLARPLLFILKTLHQGTNNWGFAIILLTLLVRLLLLPVNIKSYKSMKVMQKIQPQIKELREQYKEDPQKLNTEVMKLMKEHKTNPLGGCLPLFFQFPVFFALYRVLGESAELYQAPFIFWIQDLSLKDSYFVLPVLGGLTLFVQQKLTPMNVPKAQQRILVFMPLVFSVFMLGLPSGLTLYIFISGLFGLLQHQFFAQFRIS